MPKDELIAALEKATGAASGFDMMIANHLYPGDLDMQRAARDGRWSPTKSIDAALTLADSETDPLDLLEEALASCRDERDGVHFLPLHICIAALRATERGEPKS